MRGVGENARTSIWWIEGKVMMSAWVFFAVCHYVEGDVGRNMDHQLLDVLVFQYSKNVSYVTVSPADPNSSHLNACSGTLLQWEAR